MNDWATLTPVTQLIVPSKSIKTTFFSPPRGGHFDLGVVKKTEVASGLLCHKQSINRRGGTQVGRLSVSTFYQLRGFTWHQPFVTSVIGRESYWFEKPVDKGTYALSSKEERQVQANFLCWNTQPNPKVQIWTLCLHPKMVMKVKYYYKRHMFDST